MAGTGILALESAPISIPDQARNQARRAKGSSVVVPRRRIDVEEQTIKDDRMEGKEGFDCIKCLVDFDRLVGDATESSGQEPY